jgi:GTP-binding protein Era
MEEASRHRAGFVNIIGNPNVGKSTLMNSLIGEKLSIVTSKAQTTRHRIMGIINGEDFQIVFSDTPGILTPKYKLQESMMNFVDTAIGDADIILYVTDVVETPARNSAYIEKLKMVSVPVLIVINKADLSNQDKLGELVEFWHNEVPEAEILPISAREKFNTSLILRKIISLLPESPAWFDKNTFTDRNLRFFASEIIREKIFLNYEKEVPYSCEVVIDSFKEEPDIYKIDAVIFTERDSQKGIIIGKSGTSLKRVATDARKEMESFFEKRVFLQIFVKVNPDWREDNSKLKKFGYISE